MKTIFVSSTFRDMDAERDAIQQMVAPALNREARRHGQSISFCDLRWGIDTSLLETENGSRKVLDVCLDEIDRCQPPMVVILGYRYGWIPSRELVASTAQRYAMELDDLEKSVTALEIEYGALKDPGKLENTLFYFRKIQGEPTEDYLAEDAEHACRLQTLKDRIRKLTGGRVREYTLSWNEDSLTGVEDFAKMLSEDLLTLLQPQWQRYDDMTSFQKELHIHETYLQEKAAAFRARKALAERVLEEIENGRQLTILRGGVGSGKSTLLSHLSQQLRKQGWNTLTLYSNLTTDTSTAVEILQLMVRYLEENLSQERFSRNSQLEEHMDGENLEKIREILTGKTQREEQFGIKHWRQRLEQLCAQYVRTGRKLVFCLDAVDQLFHDDFRDELIFLPDCLGKKIRFVMTCLPEVALKGNPAITIPPIEAADKKQVIDGILHTYNRELSSRVKEAMLSLPGSDNPLYLSFLVQRLLMMDKADFDAIRGSGDGMEAITEHQLAVLRRCPGTLTEMSAELMEAASRRVGGSMVEDELKYLALAPHGLRPGDLSTLLGSRFNLLDFAHFISYMNDCFVIRNDGCYDFSHKSIREGLLKQHSDAKSDHRALLDHFAALDLEDDVRRREIIYHCIHADDKAFFVSYIKEHLYEENETIEYAAKAAYDGALQDGGDWLCGVLENAENLGADVTLIKFVVHYFVELSVSRLSELPTLRRVLEANLAVARHNEEMQKSKDSSFALANSLRALAGCCEEQGKPEDMEHAISLRQQQLALVQRVYEETGNVTFLKMLAQAHEDMSDSQKDPAEIRGHLRKALDYRKKLAEFTKRESDLSLLAYSYLGLADEYCSMFYPNLDEAEDCIREAYRIYRKLYKADPCTFYQARLAAVEGSWCQVYRYRGNYTASYKHSKKRIALLQKVIEQDNGLSVRYQLASAYYNFSNSYYSMLRKKDRILYSRKGMELFRGIVQERGSVYDKRNLALSLMQTADLMPKDTQAAKQTELELLLEAETIMEELIAAQNKNADKQNLAQIVRSLYFLYEEKDPEKAKYYESRFDQLGFADKGNAYTEVLEVLRHMDKKVVDKIPKELIMTLYDRCNMNYEFTMTKQIGEEKLSEEALAILSLIHECFWKGKT